jgi:hypothetical protein
LIFCFQSKNRGKSYQEGGRGASTGRKDDRGKGEKGENYKIAKEFDNLLEII